MKNLVAALLLAGCVSQKLKVEPVKVEPIHLTIDINLHDSTSPSK
jgi:hypothetical protein